MISDRGDRRPRPLADEGSALIMVLGAMTVAMLVVSVALSYAMQTMAGARHSTEWNQAFAAAEAGVDDYLARLNKDDNYWLTSPAVGHQHLGEAGWDWDCDNTALQRTFDASPAPCGWDDGTDAGWMPVNGSDRAFFHYDLDVVSTPVDGTIDLVSTGRVGNVTRSIEVTLRRGGFGEFLYATTYETTDPAEYDHPDQVYEQCAKYYWAGRRGCQDITFIGGDKLNGPVHSNDTILMTDGTSTDPLGPWFTDKVTTSDPSCAPHPPDYSSCYRNGNAHGSVHPRFDKGMTHRDEVDLPESIGNLQQYVDRPDAAPSGWKPAGCLYTGATRIEFHPAASGDDSGTMTVWSPGSRGTQLNDGCGDPGGDWPQPNLAVPENGLIYVRTAPADPDSPPDGPCAPKTFGTAPSGGDLPSASDWNQTQSAANCREGTAYVNGTLRGRVTVSAENNIVVTGDLTYQGGENGTDVLGLIADNSVQIYHPVNKGRLHGARGSMGA